MTQIRQGPADVFVSFQQVVVGYVKLETMVTMLLVASLETVKVK